MTSRRRNRQTHFNLNHWLAQTPIGQVLRRQECDFMQMYLDNMLPERILQMGADVGGFRLPEHSIFLIQNSEMPADVVAESMRTPWQNQMFDAVWAAHTADNLGDADAVRVWFAEMWRIVKPHGRLILTGWNPYSLWRLGRYLGLPDVSRGLPLNKLKNMAESNHWMIEQGRFMNYLPPVRSQKWVNRLMWLELAGNRWFPHGAAVYGLVLRKDVAGVLPTQLYDLSDEFLQEPVLALARNGVIK